MRGDHGGDHGAAAAGPGQQRTGAGGPGRRGAGTAEDAGRGTGTAEDAGRGAGTADAGGRGTGAGGPGGRGRRGAGAAGDAGQLVGTARAGGRGAGAAGAAPSRGVTLLLSAACAASVANVYFAQPLLVTLGRDFSIGTATVGAVVTLTQIGYGLGLFFLVPLGDTLDRRRLVVVQLLLLATALTVVGTARSAAVLLVGLGTVGLLAVVTQTLVAHAASLAPPEERGRVVGLVTSGVVTGILLARTVSGLLADLAGWRSVYLSSAALTCVLALTLHRLLPSRTDATPLTGDHGPTGGYQPAVGYGHLLRSTVTLFAREHVLRVRALLALLVFAAFSTLWSSVALPLSAPPFSLSHTEIGAFGLAGAAGALAATAAGRLNDRGFAQRTTGIGLALLAASWLPLALTRHSLWALAAGVIVLDLAVQAVHVTNQTLIHALHPAAGSRLIGGYMVFYSIGSACGAVAATRLYAAAGWTAVCALGAGTSLLAFLVWALDTKGRTIRENRRADGARKGRGHAGSPCRRPTGGPGDADALRACGRPLRTSRSARP